MYRFFTFLFLALIIQINGQTSAPKFINYQGVARDAAGLPIITPFDIHFVIKDLTNIVHDEVQTGILPNQYGLFSTQIGMAPNTLTLSNWNNGVYTLDVFIKPGNTFVLVGSQTLVSVPFSLFAGTVPSSYTNNILTIGNNSYNLSSVSVASPTIYGTGVAVVTPSTGTTFTVDVPPATINFSGNTLVFNQGSTSSSTTFSGTVSGDVVGPLNSTTVTALRNIPIANLTPTNGQSLVYNGSVWTPSAVASATLPAATWVKSTSTVTLANPTDNVGIGIPNPVNRLSVQSSLASAAILAANSSGPNNSLSNGITARTDNANAAASGIYGENTGNGYGIYGANINASGTNPIGVYGKTSGTGTSGVGVLGENNGPGASVQGINFSGSGSAVQGVNQGVGIAVHGVKSPSTTSGNAGKFEILSTNNNADAVFATTAGIGAAVHAAASPTLSTSALALLVENGHIKAISNLTPLTNTVTNSLGGFSPTASITAQSNDVRGVVTVNIPTFTGASPSAFVDVVVTFNKSYSIGPSVFVTPLEPGKFSYVVINQGSGSFTVRIINNSGSSANFAAGFSFLRFNYFVIE